MPNVLSVLLGVIILLAVFAGYFLVGQAPRQAKITWGVNFSQKYASELGLDWQAVFLALLDDLKAKNIKLLTHWDLIEDKAGEYNFDDLDWQLNMIQEKEAKAILVIGMKTGRWPECHIPDWLKNASKTEQQERILALLQKIVLRYQARTNIIAWQVENESFFPFGECPWSDKKFLEREIALVKSLDRRERPVIVSDSGEGAWWFRAAGLGDIVGITIYRRVWSKPLGLHVSYPLPPIFYWRKAQIIKALFKKEVFCGELQAEPWCRGQVFNCSPEEQKKTMDLAKFRANISFARNTGLSEFYLWGAEWLYWLKEKDNNPQLWQEAKSLFQ